MDIGKKFLKRRQNSVVKDLLLVFLKLMTAVCQMEDKGKKDLLLS